MKKKTRNILIILLLTLIILAGSITGIVLAIKKKDNGGGDDQQEETYDKLVIAQKNPYKIQQSMQTLGTATRHTPQVSNEGMCTRYPVHGTALSNVTDEEKTNLYAENKLLMASDNDSSGNNGTYNSMDKDGNLYLDGVATGKKLYKHTASIGMYYGDVSDTEPAVVEKITLNAKEMRNYITGLYAPAGEVVKIEISQEDLDSIGGMTVFIGQVCQRNYISTIKTTRNDITRMPTIVNRMVVKSPTTYVGNYFGGPIYIFPNKRNVEFSVVISGAVKYPYYIHGYTNKEDLKEMEKLTAPYYDFEVWDTAVRHSGSRKYGNFDYDNLYKVGEYWEKVARTSQKLPSGSLAGVGIGFIYDSYVTVGLACAFVGGNWVEAPSAALANALDYKLITSSGIWGTMHELNHHYQNYGLNSYGEVTNNATTILSYVSYTNISATRSENDNTLSGWNRYTDPTRSLKETISNGAIGQTTLNTYVDLIHSFGVDAYIKAARYKSGQHGADVWYESLTEATGYDMTYYFEDMLGYTISDEVKAKYTDKNLPMFVPVACLYQTGRSYLKDGKEVFTDTVRPYRVIKGKEYILDFENQIVVPDGFEYTIKEITNPAHGTLTKISDKKYKILPTTTDNTSGIFKVKLGLTHPTITTPDVTLNINLEFTDPSPTKTKYVYSSRVYSTANEAVINNFKGYSSMTVNDTNTTFMNGISNNQIGVVEGKIYIPEDGTYTICLRAGRGNHILYTSKDGGYYTEAISFNGSKGGFEIAEDHNATFTLKKGDYLYYKQVTVSDGSADAFTELGWTTNNSTPVSIPSNYLYNVNASHQEYNFTSNALYPNVYSNQAVDNVYTNNSEITNLVSSSHGYWDETTIPENMFDGNPDTFYHTNQNNFVSSDNPCDIIVDLGETKQWNTLTITNRSTGTKHMPITFKLYGGTTLDNMVLIKEYTNANYSNITLNADFDTTTFRYAKLSITDTSTHRYVSIAEINFGYKIVGTEISCDQLTYYNFNINKSLMGTFGHLISGNGYIEYTLNGKEMLLYTRQDTACKIKVEIDGEVKEYTLAKTNKKEYVRIKGNDTSSHNIKITVLQGTLFVDSALIVE